MHGANTSSDQIGIRKVAQANCAVVASGDQIDELIAVASLDVKLWMPTRHLGEYGCEVGWSKGQRRGNAHAAAKLSRGQQRLSGNIHLIAHSVGIVTKRRASLGEIRTSRGTGEQLNAQLRLKLDQPPADNGFGNAETSGCRGDASRIGNLDEGPQFLDIHFVFLFLRHS
ncbi:hypothetical protein SAMN02787076_05747 [Rhizobacter sp. OV335]|nr:hypothetical protein SAMN02787076_05747 [Rhizobacter sp. OV335]